MCVWQMHENQTEYMYIQLVYYNVVTGTMGVLGGPMQASRLDSREALSLRILKSTTWTEVKWIQKLNFSWCSSPYMWAIGS